MYGNHRNSKLIFSDRWLPDRSETDKELWVGCYDAKGKRAQNFRAKLRKRIDAVWDDESWIDTGLKCDPSLANNPAAVRARRHAAAQVAICRRLKPLIDGILGILEKATDADAKLCLLTVLQRHYDDTTMTWEKAKANIVRLFNLYHSSKIELHLNPGSKRLSSKKRPIELQKANHFTTWFILAPI